MQGQDNCCGSLTSARRSGRPSAHGLMTTVQTWAVRWRPLTRLFGGKALWPKFCGVADCHTMSSLYGIWRAGKRQCTRKGILCTAKLNLTQPCNGTSVAPQHQAGSTWRTSQ